MSIWFKPRTLADLPHIGMANHLGIEFLEVGPDFLTARMPVDDRTRQPYGVLHGGASVALAETLGSVGANFATDETKFLCFGQEINANHIRSVSSGYVIGSARALHLGRRSHVWEIRIVNEQDKLVCVSRLTVAIVEREADK